MQLMHGTDGALMFLLKSALCCPSHLNKTHIYGVLTLDMAVEYMNRGEKWRVSVNSERGTWIIHRVFYLSVDVQLSLCAVILSVCFLLEFF